MAGNNYLIRRPGSQRLWVVQEAVLGRQLVFMCEDTWVIWETWSGFCKAMHAIEVMCIAVQELQNGQAIDHSF